MKDEQLLLMVRARCDPRHLSDFQTQQNEGLSNLLRSPAFLWAKSYVDIDDASFFTTLMGIRECKDLPALFDFEGPPASPVGLAEHTRLPEKQGLSGIMMNVYEQSHGSPLGNPFLCSDRPLSLVTTDVAPAVEAEWNRWYNESHIPHLLKVPGYVLAARFRTLDDPMLATFNTGPRYLALYECESEAAIPSVRPGPRMSPEAKLELQSARRMWVGQQSNFFWGFVKMVSKHSRRE